MVVYLPDALYFFFKTVITILLTKPDLIFLLCLTLLSSMATKALLPPIRIFRLISSRLTALPQISLNSVVTLVNDWLLPHTPSPIISTCLFLKPCDKLRKKLLNMTTTINILPVNTLIVIIQQCLNIIIKLPINKPANVD